MIVKPSVAELLKKSKKLLTFPQIYIILTYVIETRRGSVW